MTIPEAARRLSIHPETVRKWLRSGRMSGVKLGNAWRLRDSDLTAFVTANARRGNRGTDNDTPHNGRSRHNGNGHIANGTTAKDEYSARRGTKESGDYLRDLDAHYAAMQAEGFTGVNGAELVNEIREERTAQVAGE